MSQNYTHGSYDEEKDAAAINTETYTVEDAPDQVIANRFGSFGPLLSKLFKSGVEARGVERVPEYQRDTKNFWNSLFMWWSVNMVLTTIPVGTLGQYAFTLSLPHAAVVILCFATLGCLATAFIATLGPRTGLRTMIIVRYSSGYLGGVFYSILNIITQLGFATIVVILGGQTLASVNANALPLVVGVVIIGICSLIPCFIGYEMVHVYERYAWIMTLFIMCCLYGLGGKAGYNANAQKPLEDTGRALAADVLSYGSIVFGAVTGWSPIAADYAVRLPADTNPWHVFIMTFFGMLLPIVFTQTLGAVLMTITNSAYVAAFGPGGNTGALVAQVLSPWGSGGKVLLVLLSFSVIANNIPNTYSAALSIQALGRPFAMIPRFLWVIFVFLVYTVAGVVGREHFITILNNFLSILSYWTAFFIVIIIEEHFIFRQKGGRLGGYNLADWDNPSKHVLSLPGRKVPDVSLFPLHPLLYIVPRHRTINAYRLPIGIAGLLAAFSGIAGAVIGMSQVWYKGPVGRMVGTTNGADLGFELAAGFAAVTFPPLRWIEIRLTGR